MTEHEPRPDADLDPAADTARFQAFVEDDPTDPAGDGERRAVGAPFRLATLLVGLGVFAALVWLLLKI